ncbi:Methyltransferase [Paraburkholderia piptadeniae]|uniref:Methyltransferase n=1 Tax=Paraburkholderia piptadeniae TaxID=1701573 RepID=A0A1N7SF56_9BURK|nr:class I SAM-dependent methyltransferase [Paraburkholderia piptadeniae]SIT46001.1 Methyltransferase [Paraburkholderia piptadeniae]
MPILPPGTLLQLMYLKDRLRRLRPGRFVEIGPGAGHISALLLDAGWSGVAYDLEASTVAALEARFPTEIASGRYRPVHGNWLELDSSDKFDLVLSCMVLEHFDDAGERIFIDVARRNLSPDGTMITIVPGSPKHWGIEDEIAGHFRRYTSRSVAELFAASGWQIKHAAGLTFPVSNVLLPLSNFLVRRSEARKLSLSMIERTKQSGIRNVPMKTTFPTILKFLLNERSLLPLHLLQKLFVKSDSALVLYVETEPLHNPVPHRG